MWQIERVIPLVAVVFLAVAPSFASAASACSGSHADWEPVLAEAKAARTDAVAKSLAASKSGEPFQIPSQAGLRWATDRCGGDSYNNYCDVSDSDSDVSDANAKQLQLREYLFDSSKEPTDPERFGSCGLVVPPCQLIFVPCSPFVQLRLWIRDGVRSLRTKQHLSGRTSDSPASGDVGELNGAITAARIQALLRHYQSIHATAVARLTALLTPEEIARAERDGAHPRAYQAELYDRLAAAYDQHAQRLERLTLWIESECLAREWDELRQK